MSAVLVAAFNDHETADRVRTLLVKDGFPTDRVELTSRQELGQAGVTPVQRTEDKLTEYFSQLFPDDSARQQSVQRFQRAVLEGRAVIAVQPRGETETQRAVQILNDGQPIELRARDLGDQALEHAADEQEIPILTWIGRVLITSGTRP